MGFRFFEMSELFDLSKIQKTNSGSPLSGRNRAAAKLGTKAETRGRQVAQRCAGHGTTSSSNIYSWRSKKHLGDTNNLL